MIQKLILNQCLPFSLVESDDFKLLIQEGYPTLKVISRPTLMKRFDSNVVDVLKNLKKEMSVVNHVTTTADCWSIFKRYVCAYLLMGIFNKFFFCIFII